jgi:hypothetical protein
MHLRKSFGSILVLSLLAASSSFSQINEGTVIGTARDAAGAAVPGATIVVTNTATNVSSSILSNSVGEYLITNLVAGRYTVSCQFTGFRKEVFTDLILRSGTISRVDFTLQPGDVLQEVTVTSEAPLLQTENASVGASIPNESVVELPLRGRLALDLALLENGVAQAAKGTSASRQEQLGGEYGKSVVISGVREH